MSKTKQKIQQEHDDRAMIQDPNKWPRWPYLPLKRESKTKEPWPDTALLMDTSGPLTIYFVNMFRLGELSQEQFKQTKTQEYASVDDLLADGWVVD